MDPKGRDGNTVSEYHICKNDLYGKFWNQPKAYDKLSVVMVTLDERQETGDEYLNMMNTLLSTEKTVEAKKKELLEQYHLSMENQLGKEIDIMCNLSELVEEKGIEKGKQDVVARLLVQGMII